MVGSMGEMSWRCLARVALGLFLSLETRAACTEIPAEKFSWETLSERIKADPSIRKVEDLLCILPQNFREFYALAFRSRSLHQASSLNPRVLLFDAKDPAGMILSFNGNPMHDGFDNVEIIRAKDRERGTIQFIDVEFARDFSRPAKITMDPPKCLACHGTRLAKDDARFLFDASPVWEGFYGSDLFGQASQERRLKEREEFKAFQSSAATHPRYQHLLSILQRRADRQDKDSPGIALDDINQSFTIKLAEYNHRRLLRFVMESEHYAYYKYAIYGVLHECRAVEEFIPPEMRRWHTNESRLVDELRGVDLKKITPEQILAIRKRTALESRTNYSPEKFLGEQIVKKASQVEPIPYKFEIDGYIKQQGYGANVDVNANLRYLFEARVKPVPMEEWNIDIEQGFYRFNNNDRVDFDIVALAPLLRAADPDLKDAPAGVESSMVLPPTPAGCDELKAKSREALSRLAKVIKAPRLEEARALNLRTGRAIVDRHCAHCHKNEPAAELVPQLDFNDPSVLEHYGSTACDRISRGAMDAKRMPKFLNLEKSQITALKAYFRKLSPAIRCP